MRLGASAMAVVLVVGLTLAAAHAGDPDAGAEPETPWIGVSIQKGSRGVMVMGVIEGTPGEYAGLKKNDEIVEVAGAAVTEPDQLIDEVKKHAVGDVVEVRVWRDNKRRKFKITLSAKLDEEGLLRRQLVGKRARNFSLPVVKGSDSGTLTDHLGSVVLLEFWGSHSTESRAVIDDLSALAAEKREKGLVILGISSESRAKQKEFLEGRRVGYTLLYDYNSQARGQWGYGIKKEPTHVIVDREGYVTYVSQHNDVDELKDAIDAALRDRNRASAD